MVRGRVQAEIFRGEESGRRGLRNSVLRGEVRGDAEGCNPRVGSKSRLEG